MTNGWTDIRNADVVLAMGGNPAENHPVGFRFVMEARRNRNAKLVCVDPRFNRTAAVADAVRADSRRHRHRVSRRSDPLRAVAQSLPRGLRPRVHQRAVPGEGQLRVRCRRSGVFSGWDRRTQGLHRHVELGLRARRTRLCPDRPVDAAPAIGVPGDEGVLRALHAGGGRDHLRLPRRGLPAGRRADHVHRHARIAPARSCTRSAGRTTATRCS